MARKNRKSAARGDTARAGQGSSRLVYSTDGGGRCRQCQRLLPDCVCGKAAPTRSSAGGDGIVRLARQTKGRKGAGVTLITGLPLDSDEMKALAKRLKQLCGVGGTVVDGVIEIQGEQRQRLADELSKLGYQVKIAGG